MTDKPEAHECAVALTVTRDKNGERVWGGVCVICGAEAEPAPRVPPGVEPHG